jgi:alpha-D-xyloside xylohydrolase
VPFGPELQYTDEKPADPVTLFVYTGKDASFSLYEDEGTNYNYEKGKFSAISLSYSEKAKSLTIGDRSGSYEGMTKERTFRIIVLNPKAARKLNIDQKADYTIRYNGKQQVIKL